MDIHGPVCGPGNEFRFSRLWFCTWAALAPAMAIQNHGAIRCFESTPWPLLSQGGHLYQQQFLWSLHVSPSFEMSSNKFPHFFRLATANRRHWITGETPGKRPFLCGLPKKNRLSRTGFPSVNPEAAKKGTGQIFCCQILRAKTPKWMAPKRSTPKANPVWSVWRARGSVGLKPRPGPTLHSKFAILVLRLEGLHQTDWYLGAVLSAKICISFVPQYICKEWGP